MSQSTTISLAVEQVGPRLYVTGNSYSVKDDLKSAGCKWDGERKQWWGGIALRDRIEEIVGKLSGSEAPTKSLDDSPVYGKVSYTGKSGKSGTYYVIGSSSKNGPTRLRLTNLAGSIDFWADESACQWVKRYEARDVGFRGYGNPRNNTREYQTLGGLRRFIDRSRKADQQIAAGEVPAGYAIDNEDGCVKRISECDMPDRSY